MSPPGWWRTTISSSAIRLSIHSRADRPDIGQRFIAVAAQALRPGGQLLLVANRHLPYEQVLNESFGQVRVAAERDGFKLISAIRGRGARA